MLYTLIKDVYFYFILLFTTKITMCVGCTLLLLFIICLIIYHRVTVNCNQLLYMYVCMYIIYTHTFVYSFVGMIGIHMSPSLLTNRFHCAIFLHGCESSPMVLFIEHFYCMILCDTVRHKYDQTTTLKLLMTFICFY